MQKPPSSPESKVPFYRVVYKGRQLQSIWQGAVGASLLVGLVIFPLVGMYSHDMLNSPLLPSLHKRAGMSCVFILTLIHTHTVHTVRKHRFMAPALPYTSPEQMQEMVRAHRVELRKEKEEARKQAAR